MIQGTASGLPKLPRFDPPDVDLGFPLRHSAKAKQGVGEAIKGAYVQGGISGYSIGQQVGYAAGETVGFLKGAASASLSFGLIFFCVCTFLRLSRR